MELHNLFSRNAGEGIADCVARLADEVKELKNVAIAANEANEANASNVALVASFASNRKRDRESTYIISLDTTRTGHTVSVVGPTDGRFFKEVGNSADMTHDIRGCAVRISWFTQNGGSIVGVTTSKNIERWTITFPE